MWLLDWLFWNNTVVEIRCSKELWNKPFKGNDIFDVDWEKHLYTEAVTKDCKECDDVWKCSAKAVSEIMNELTLDA